MLSGTLLVLAALQAEPARVVVQPADITLEVDATRRLNANAFTERDELIDGIAARWFSTDTTVVTVSGNGVAKAIRPGSARIFAMVGRRPGFATVMVPQLPPATLELTLAVGAVAAGASAPLRLLGVTRLGDTLETFPVRFESGSPEVARVDDTGRVFGRRAGSATVTAHAGRVTARVDVRVAPSVNVEYALQPTDGSARTGDVVRFRVDARGSGGAAAGHFLPAWTVSGAGAQIEAEGAEGVFVAEHPGTYRVTALIGEDLAKSALVRVAPRQVAGRLSNVGRGPASTHHSGDTWVFQGVDGRDYAYIGTFQHDWMKAWDVTDPERPVLVDSLQVDARRINDVKIHPNNRLAIITREGASSRRNGIVLLDLSQPAHPTILSEYTETVTGGVHNVWIRGDENLVYACHNGTSDLHIIDIADPRTPREVGRWGLDRPSKTLHDVIVQDGYAYLSYWDDGVVMLDVGAGTHGGTPTQPAFVSQFKYPIGNTHVAWRHGKYLFVGDEIFPEGWDPAAPIDARGYVHVLDMTEPERPREVARYEVPEAGAHNLWAEGDRLYVGYYQAGLRVVDISGELRGDLYRQGREVAALPTTDAQSVVPNWSMTWGAQLYKGNIYTSDLFSGLWIAHLDEQRPVP